LPEGDSVSDFIETVRQMPFMLTVISDRYLRSAYCLSELVGFYDRCERNKDIFRGRTGRAILDDARIAPLDRGQYHDFWESGRKRYRAEAALRPLSDDEHRVDQRIPDWCATLPQILSHVSDAKTSARGNTALMADNCAAIVQMLEAAFAARPTARPG